jgi:cysteinyl-tRNA synthetase
MQAVLEWAKASGRENDISSRLLEAVNSGQLSDSAIEAKIAEMEAARKARKFDISDRIRAELTSARIIVENTKEGVRWRRK